MQDDIQEKTEQGTYHHIEKARSQGIRYYSSELNSLLVFLSVTILGYFYISDIVSIVSKIMVGSLSFNHSIINSSDFFKIIISELRKIVFLFVLFFLMYVIFIFIASIILNGFCLYFNFIKLQNLNFYFFNFFKNIFSTMFYVKYISVFLKFLVMFLIIILYLKKFFFKIVNLSFFSALISLTMGFKIIFYFIIFIFIGFIPIVMIDILWNKFNYDNKLKMSYQEIKDEQKDSSSKSHIYGNSTNSKKLVS